MYGDSLFISLTLLKVLLYKLLCLIVIVEQWPGSTLHVTPHSGLQVSKEQNVSAPLTRKDLLLWRASVTDSER